MHHLTPVEHPADRSPARWVFDVLVALVAAAAALPYLFHDNRHPQAIAVAVLVVVVAPLAVRRMYPVAVFAWVLVTAVAAGAWNDHLVPGLALIIAAYTVAAMQPRRDAIAAAVLLELAMIGAAVRADGGRWWYDAIFLTGLVGAALGMGLYASTRRAYLAELRERAARLEYERDQQGALAAAAERARIAREMHDIVAHHLTVMVALSDGAIAATAAAPERGIEVMRSVSATGRRALADTRRLMGVLRTGPDQHAGDSLEPIPDLADLDTLIDRVRDAGLAISLEVTGVAAGEVPSGIQLTVYRLVQEALTNTLKHAGADAHAAVRLRYLPGQIQVEVTDDGAFASTIPAGVGAGLTGMRERVHAYGGEVHTGPGDAGGWRVSALLHLDDAVSP